MQDVDTPSFEKLIKLMKMTTASNDGEALNAVRMANAMLTRLKADWERLLRGKVTVIEDPFSRIATPPVHSSVAPSMARPAPARPYTSPPKPKSQTPVFRCLDCYVTIPSYGRCVGCQTAHNQAQARQHRPSKPATTTKRPRVAPTLDDL